ncbi:ATP-independent RNA helicase DbpA [Solimonas aquatica]|uniref:ATP-independent RNA helicase DbpA n=1 Tax=Solimonas aquatica TaxID=489703 RepID=A0A1H9GFV9_9GAMM|nr:ATP-dependent RNA helicase DbpA [Solimonas aquatica]SEQ49012.1 ATP-independent RNA helicase DbpA [Solimonas aquatica]
MNDATPGLAFSTLPLNPALLQALESLHYERMTPIQALSLPPMLEGRDVIGQARTGTGKTAAYGLALLSRIDPTLAQVQALVLCPTRELADQVAKEIRRLARCLPNVKLTVLSGGIDTRPQLASLVHPPQVVVGMAGRVQELIEAGALQLDQLRVLVLDEADRMLGADFEAATRTILKQAPATRQTLFFSATFPDAVRALSRQLQKQPVEATADATLAPPQIEQTFFEIREEQRIDALVHLLSVHRPASALVFCHTRGDVQDVERALAERGFSVIALHGHIDQRERDEVIVRFANGSRRVLVATDIAARGLDIKNLAAVLSYELPKEPEAHLHRIGRTGRAGSAGVAWHLFTERERERVKAIETQMGTALKLERLPSALSAARPLPAEVVTLCVDGGRADKLRPGDLLGALTGAGGLAKEAIGKINTYDTRTYFAVEKKQAQQALKLLQNGKIKGRKFRVRPIE